ncbi:MAG: molybdenum cofactor biosynthesis protein MoaE [Pseudodesulfovibrio sp.]|uniref:Molybdopterin synthase catalytic subunit n=1 Tax=Pseudodesulfovibrio aespoeensis (strain ATCC 700646 / DSM 10631 / Aspo-2) TaxID=643562 RepID=E6VS05_PSEA9|nr:MULTISPECIES: molybdenum cofactor biosynthesis protein MoaE [Pseudodesulfovibrio]MBU4193095.1 molybdenum cofactor biosynthesis protein MoaE [Pseudomonadota bacterium]ADU61938.1 molybdopterin biosynthesis MoaE protein [Pseudodesulfovibrio aespoeensis Aspo-2]MBU4243290.1 molybdenum cofactor biosynthesis protein MoaE [Pseudomonadota bacterium]MBU4379463.1 molybdenum cofactor biosynthesis protein MoaE [Pseudomonadota bacterium]MBU4473702.1 molybdenum cofactor biosynthesis protein MoaE [Pseudomo
MDISKAIAELKREPGFADNVGMILVHNGVVRSWSREDHSEVVAIEITPDFEKMEQIRREIEAREGIFRAVAHANGGMMQPGDDVLFLIVAGDIRENVKAALADLLDRVKAEAVTKREIFASGNRNA